MFETARQGVFETARQGATDTVRPAATEHWVSPAGRGLIVSTGLRRTRPDDAAPSSGCTIGPMASVNPWEQLSKGIDLPFHPGLVVPELHEVLISVPTPAAVGDVAKAARAAIV